MSGKRSLSRALDATAPTGHPTTRARRTERRRTGLALYTTVTTALTLVAMAGLVAPALTGLALVTCTVTGIVLALTAALATAERTDTLRATSGGAAQAAGEAAGRRPGAEPSRPRTGSETPTPFTTTLPHGQGPATAPLLVIREYRFHPAPPRSVVTDE